MNTNHIKKQLKIILLKTKDKNSKDFVFFFNLIYNVKTQYARINSEIDKNVHIDYSKVEMKKFYFPLYR